MWRKAGLAAFVVCVVTLSWAFPHGADSDSKAYAEEASKSPVDNWGGWWPSTQLHENSTVELDALGKLPRVFDRVSFGSIHTDCGFASVGFGHLESKGLRLDLSWSGPGTMATAKEWDAFSRPGAGDVKAAVVKDGEVVRKPTNGDPQVSAWFGGGLGTTGSMLIQFDWLPADFEDYWLRVDVKDKRFWLLIPYGLGSDPATNGTIKQISRGAPAQPKGVAESDSVSTWSSVDYDVFSEVEKNNLHVSARITNDEYAQLELELYKENSRWTLDTPRTSASYLWPDGYTRYGWLYELRRDTSYRRWDHFQFFHHGHETRSWGLLRVGVEDKTVDICVPSSLFHARHGTVQK